MGERFGTFGFNLLCNIYGSFTETNSQKNWVEQINPIFIYFTISGQEILELPPNPSVYIYLTLKTVLGSIIPLYLWNAAFALTSPLYMAVGSSLTIPLNFVADYFMGNTVGWSEAIGAVIVSFGCLLMNITDLK